MQGMEEVNLFIYLFIYFLLISIFIYLYVTYCIVVQTIRSLTRFAISLNVFDITPILHLSDYIATSYYTTPP